MLSFYKPKNPILSKYIEGYYFVKSAEPDFSLSYYTFPNNFQIVSCALESELAIEKDRLVSKHNKKGAFISTLTYNYSKPIKIEYRGKVNELTVYFKPLGLSHFSRNVSESYTNQHFIPFLPFEDFQREMTAVLCKSAIEDAIESLENYWISHLSNSNLEKIEQIIALVDVMNVQQAAEKVQISRQYLHKVFKSYLGKSPVEYRRIQRFRNAIDFPDASPDENLFYDQSHFIRETLKFTDNSPKKLLGKIEYKTANPWLLL